MQIPFISSLVKNYIVKLNIQFENLLQKKQSKFLANMFIIFTFIIGAYLIIQQLYADITSDILQDAPQYLTIGRGLLNGYKIYIDLFDVKSIGIFLISATSLLFGGIWLMKFFYAISYSIPCLWKNPLIICLSLFGSAATFGSLQPEAYGYLFGFLYVLNLFYGDNIYIGGILFALSVGMKEPFAISLLGAFILSRKPLKEFGIHIIIAFIIGLLALLMLGATKGYFDYIEIAFTKRSVGKELLLLRGLNVYAVGKEMGTLGLIMGSYWILRYPKILLIGLVYYFTLIFLKMIPFVYTSPLFWFGSSIYFYGVYNMRYVDYRHCFALYLFVLSTSIAGSAAMHHFIIGFPVLFALILSDSPSIIKNIRNCILALIFFLSFSISERYTSSNIYYLPKLDTVMNDCNIDQYFMIPTPQYYMNKHSPIGPVISTVISKVVGVNSKQMEKTRENAMKAKFLIVKDTNWFFNEDLSDWISKYYTNQKPTCASTWDKNWYYRL